MPQDSPAPGYKPGDELPVGFIDLVNVDVEIIVDDVARRGNQDGCGKNKKKKGIINNRTGAAGFKNGQQQAIVKQHLGKGNKE